MARADPGEHAIDVFPHAALGYSHKMADPVQGPWRALLIVFGILLVVGGLAWPLLSRYLGRLPGDIVVRRGNFTFAFPIVTCLLLSVLASLLLWLFRR
jgi:hypothetical protein